MAAEKKAGNAQKPPVFPFKLSSCSDIILFYPTPPPTIEKGEGPPEMSITYLFLIVVVGKKVRYIYFVV